MTTATATAKALELKNILFATDFSPAAVARISLRRRLPRVDHSRLTSVLAHNTSNKPQAEHQESLTVNLETQAALASPSEASAALCF